MKKAFLTAVLTVVLVACATSPTGRRQLMLVSPDQAIAASRTAYLQQMAAFEEKGLLSKDEALIERVQLITGRLVAQAVQQFPKTADWEWSVAVIDDPETVNAWAMAGGRMAIYTGLIEQTQATDDEIAQVMGHEIAHALANHTAEKMSVAMASQLGVIAVGIKTEDARAMAGAAVAATLAVNLPFSRTAETEADLIGIELAARAGYHPEAAVTLWRKMAEAGGDGPPQFLSTHPSPGNRQEKLAALVPRMMPLYEAPGERPVYPVRIAR
ncbi:M48 family metallopeptidase [Thioalkalivibrio sp. XN8]|uniref:M48 family metallopeptidase n=1 Tax=Thioalkalivibrio sp. XN8 TaxID=2712863 RepID=UPI0013EA11E3|nr:M48 family metallopeptidase [Thioalkalivibrio sp. XN8]NGP53384.1 M48 family metallopeptidase [Thioalkalivibrio sp. XN8]